jgi:hypothetical protein
MSASSVVVPSLLLKASAVLREFLSHAVVLTCRVGQRVVLKKPQPQQRFPRLKKQQWQQLKKKP